ncbi:MAG: Asp-tRNA(Asn)/Glu-tRNA(Gln) amidotransferase subunit GatC [Candidatus Omnitrophota bacterium]|nr:Asp-tRNA(Asn)/Glu-tRNA(Gln) amidotransferase subunit GatC [Candidatus Omnitrophota bacterium]
MPIQKDDVKYVARLARLKLAEEEIAYFAKQLDSIVGYMDRLGEVNISNVKPTTHVLPIQNVFRSDVDKPSLKAEDALKNAPDREKGLFKVPRIIKE